MQRLVAAQKYRDVPKTQRPPQETCRVADLTGLLDRFANDSKPEDSTSSTLIGADIRLVINLLTEFEPLAHAC